MGKQTPTLLCVFNYGEVVKAQNLASITLCPSTKARRQSRAQGAGAVDTLCDAPNGKEQKERGEGFEKKALSMADRAKQQCVPFRLSTVHESWLTLTKYEGAFFFFTVLWGCACHRDEPDECQAPGGPEGGCSRRGQWGHGCYFPAPRRPARGGGRFPSPNSHAQGSSVSRLPSFPPSLPGSGPQGREGDSPWASLDQPPTSTSAAILPFPSPARSPRALSVCPRHLGHRLPAPRPPYNPPGPSRRGHLSA